MNPEQIQYIKPTIIVVEDSRGANELICGKIEDMGYVSSPAFNYEDAKKIIVETKECFVLLDYQLGCRNSMDLVKELNEINIFFPFVVMTGYNNTQLAVNFMKSGAYDFIVKDGNLIETIEPLIIKALNRFYLEQQNKQLADSLAKSEEMYRVITENTIDVIWKLNPFSGSFTYVSPSVFKLCGYTSDEVMKLSFTESLTPESGKKITQLLASGIANLSKNTNGNEFYINEIDQPHKDGHIVHTEVTTTYLQNNKTGLEIVGVSRNITERKKAEKALAERFEMEKLISEITTAFVKNSTNNIGNSIVLMLEKIGIFTNADATYLFLIKDENLNNTYEWNKEKSLLHKEHLQNIRLKDFPFWAKNINNGEIITISEISEIPQEAENELSFFFNLGLSSLVFMPLVYIDKPIGLISLTTIKQKINRSPAITDFIKTIASITAGAMVNAKISHELIQSENRYKKLVSRLPNMIVVHVGSKITFANAAMLSNLGYTLDEIENKDIFSFIEKSYHKTIKENILKKLSGEDIKDYEIELIGKHKKYYCIIRTDKIFYNENISLLTVLTDISERKKMELQIKKSFEQQFILNSFLKLSLENITLDELLKRALESLVNLNWLVHNSKACIFLMNTDNMLEMVVQSNIPESLLNCCKIVTPGNCLCGKAAADKTITFSVNLDEQHSMFYNEILPHGHYCVPILFNEKVLGVINIYLAAGHQENNEEKEFLTACANTIAGLIIRKKSEEELTGTLENLEQIVSRRTCEITNKNKLLTNEIEERRRVESELSISKEKYKTIVEQSVYGIYIMNLSGAFIEVNNTGCALTEYSRKELLKMQLSELFDSIELSENPIRFDLLDAGASVIDERKLKSKSQNIYYIEMSSRKMPDSTYQFMFRDITEKKKTEENIRVSLEKEKELNTLKSRFISVISHEFKTPLAGILSAVQLLEKYSDKWDSKKKSDYYKQIYGSINYTNMLLNDVSLMGKDDSGKLSLSIREFDLHELINRVIIDVDAYYGSAVQIVSELNIINNIILLDETLVQHLFSNLLSNAVKYSHHSTQVFLKVEITNSCIQIEIRDCGIGIPEKDLKHIFEPFHRAENVETIKGTGFGLAIVKKCVDLMLGTIKIESKLGKGTSVFVELPERLEKT